MHASYTGGKCPFDDPLGSINVVFAEAGGWRTWVNPFPTKGSVLHTVMAPTRHLPGTPIGLTGIDFAAMGRLWEETWKNHPDKITQQDTWEAHLIVPDRTGNVRFKLGEAKSWAVTKNGELQELGWQEVEGHEILPHTQLHLAFKHIYAAIELLGVDFSVLGELFNQAVAKYHIPGGGLIITNEARTVVFAMRFGSILYSEGSVPNHQHANIIVVDPNSTEEVDVPLGKDPKKIAEGEARMHVFEALRRGHTLEELDKEDRDLVVGRV